MPVTGSIRQVLPVQAYAATGRVMHLYDMTFVTDAAAGSVGEIPIAVEPGGIALVEVIPDQGATTPTNLFDFALNDAIAAPINDLVDPAGDNLLNTETTSLQFDPPYPWKGGNLYPTLTTAGNSKTGRIRIHVAQ